jgi:hypothetical protein
MEQYRNSRSPFVTLLLTVLILGLLSLSAYGILHWYQNRSAAGPAAGAAGKKPEAAQSANQATSVTPAEPITPDGAISVEIKAPGKAVWLLAKVDDEAASSVTVDAGATRSFHPKQQLAIQLPKSQSNSLEISVNGRLVNVTPDLTGRFAKIVIDRNSLPAS